MSASDLVKVVVVASPFANMAPLYEVDPDADVLLVVPPNTKPFAPWDESLTNGVNGTSATASAAIKSSSGLRIKASSRHLALASRVFRNKLQHAGSQSRAQSDGRIHLSLAEGFDAKAVSIVLNAIHSRGPKVPRAVDLETLAQIAHFVDRFQLFDVVDVYADRWISTLEEKLAEAYDRDLVLWIYASHVFRRPEVFKAATMAAVAHSSGPLRTLGLPIREKIIRDIDTQRQALVSQSLGLVHSTLDELTSGTAACQKYNCDAFLLGGLIKALHKSRLVWPRPAKPFIGVSHAAIVEAVNASAQLQLWDTAPATDLWGVPVDGTKLPNRKRKSPVQQPITPESSPEPAARSLSNLDSHVCEARKLIGRLEELDGLGEGAVGLELESGLGYQLY